jgi:uncharacterized protein with FMN-binding domain
MKKLFLSATLIGSFGLYAVLYRPADIALPAAATPAPIAQTTPAPKTQGFNATPQQPIALVRGDGEGEGEGEDGYVRAPAPTQTAPAPAPTPAPTPTQPPAPKPTPAPAPKPKGQYADGSYTGSQADAYYGIVQVRATVSGGKLTDVTFLSYPSDRGTSRQINSIAMPYLIQEAIQAQSANVQTVSGASDTSAAFRQSLGSALAQAKV